MKIERYIVPLILVVCWQGLSSIGIIGGTLLPSPLDILLGVKDLLIIGMPPGYLLPYHILYSLYRVTLGFAAAAISASLWGCSSVGPAASGLW